MKLGNSEKLAKGIKELSIEEKAKAYDEAIERLRNAFYDNSGRMCEEYRKAVIKIIEPIFPQLKESEDEKIRKWIREELKSKYVVDNIVNDVMADKALAWLEERGEQKSAWSEEDEDNRINAIKYLELFDAQGIHGDVAVPCIEWLKCLKNRVQPQNLTVTDEELAQAKKDAYNDVLDKIEYDSENPTFDDGWSAAIWYLKKKNVQPQNTWKPSDEQMEALLYEVNAWDEDSVNGQNLKSLYQGLKKLRGE